MDAHGNGRMQEPARLDRLLRRHVGVCDEEVDGRSCLIRGAELLVPASGAAAAEDALRRWSDGREDLEGPGVARFRLRPTAERAVLDLAGEGLVHPNHLLRGEPAYSGGPADVPQVPQVLPPAPAAPAPAAREVVVAVLDTGLDPHPWFTGQPWYEPRDDAREVLDADLDYRLDAQAGHGTFVAGVVRAAAPTARIEPVRVLGSDGVCDELELVLALHRLHARTTAAGRPVDVLNLSLGGYRWDDRPSPLLARALARFGRDTVVVAAAGNNGSDRPFWPAALKTVLAVGALDGSGERAACFSNTGPWVDAWAPGERVVSSFVQFDGPSGDGARGVPDGIDPDAFDGFAVWSGTSFAAPAVAGAVAAGVAAGQGTAADVAWSLLHDDDAPVRSDGGVRLAPPQRAAPAQEGTAGTAAR